MTNINWGNPNVANMRDLYVAMFNRVPDIGGLNFWSGLLDSGLPMSFVAQQFVDSAYREGTYYNFSMSDNQFITALYETVLGRTGTLAPAVDELAFWSHVLNDVNHGNRGEFALLLVNETKKLKVEGVPELQKTVDILINKIALVEYTLDKSSLPGNRELTVDESKAFFAQIGDTAASVANLKAKLDTVLSQQPDATSFTVAQIQANAHHSTPYHLVDTLKNIAAADAIRDAAIDYKISNWPGTVGAATVHEAEVLQKAKNGGQYDFSLTDTLQKIWPDSRSQALVDLIKEADTVSIVGTDAASETFLLNGMPRGVIVNGNGGDDRIIGTTFNDVFYGGSGRNEYFGNGGSDTYNLTAGAADFINLSKSSNKSFDGVQFVKNFGSEDRIVIRQADVSANLEGSWTPDDFGSVRIFSTRPLAGSETSDIVFENNSIASMHGAGAVFLTTPIAKNVDLDGTIDGSKLIDGKAGIDPFIKLNFIECQNGWAGFLIAYEDGNQSRAFVYFASDTTGDARLRFDEIRLVAVVDHTAGQLNFGSFAL